MSYEEAFAKIEEATGIKDVDKLVDTFITGEDKNFKLYTFVNGQSDDIENLETQIGQIQGEIDHLRDMSELNQGDVQRRKDIKEMEKQLRKVENDTEKYQQDYNYSQGRLESIMTCVQQIFQLIDCDAESNDELLGTQGVTENNMMIYMGIVEQRINEILQANAYIMQQKQFSDEGAVKFNEISGFGIKGFSLNNMGSIIPQPHIGGASGVSFA